MIPHQVIRHDIVISVGVLVGEDTEVVVSCIFQATAGGGTGADCGGASTGQDILLDDLKADGIG